MFNPYEEIYKQLNEIKSIINNKASIGDNSPRYFLYNEAAKFLSISPNALRVMVHKNQIQSCKKLGKRYFLQDDLINWIESGREVVNKDYAENILSRRQDF
ncbi:helix-turn-helix domain-containing protein [Pedobacter agri]|uniref:helix-turn-helix domain-containing protein n=1 Tax=Pedobacter agri TaxID=454586 RepID=UPI00352065D5